MLNGTTGGSCLGGACNQQQNSEGIACSGDNDIVKNMIVSHIYVHIQNTNDSVGDNNHAITFSGNHVQASFNTLDNAYTAISKGGSNMTMWSLTTTQSLSPIMV